MVYPSDDPNVPNELTKLRGMLPAHTALLIGGRAAYGYYQALRVPDVRLVNCLAEIEAALEEISVHSCE
ncbi:hypothetical protein [Verrucomicrobium spinosum]|nr:hypothetical protein [Verrucomicrobium spinosum]